MKYEIETDDKFEWIIYRKNRPWARFKCITFDKQQNKWIWWDKTFRTFIGAATFVTKKEVSEDD